MSNLCLRECGPGLADTSVSEEEAADPAACVSIRETLLRISL